MRKVVSILFALVLALGLCLVMAVPASAGAITLIDVTPVDDTAGATTDYSLGFTIATGELTSVVIDFIDFGAGPNDMDLSGVSTNVAHYTFGGFAVNPSGVAVDNGLKTVTFTGGTTTGAGAHTIDNAAPGTGLVITNDQLAATHDVDISTTSDVGSIPLTINPAAAHHLKVTGAAGAITAGGTKQLTVKAYDQYDNLCDSGINDYSGDIGIIFSGPGDAPDTTRPTVTDKDGAAVDVGTSTLITFTNGTSTAGGLLTAYKAESVDVDVAQNGGINSTGDVAWDFPLTVNPGPVATLVMVQQPTDTVVYAHITPAVTVRAEDTYGNVIAAQNVAVALQAGTGVLSGTSPRMTNGLGIATFNDLSIDTVGPGKVLRFTANGAIVDSNPFIILPDAIDHYAVSAIASPVGATVPFNVIIQAQDVYNNNITTGGDAAENITITFGIADAGATPTTTATTNGVALVSVTVTVPQTFGQSITFTGVTSGKTGTSNTFDVAAVSGGGGASSPSGEGFVNISSFLDADGRATVVITLTSTNGLVTVNIPSGTLVLDAQGNPLTNLQIVVLSTPPPPPGYVMVGRAYDCLPDGATFQPAMKLTFSYYEPSVPQGASEEDLVIAYWGGEQWVNLPTTVDTAANTATADVAHFTPFALLIEAPAEGAPPEEAPPEEAPPEEAPAEAEPLNIWIIVGIIAAVIVVGLIVFMLVRRRA